MTPQEQAPAADRREIEFQRACEEAALRVLCDHKQVVLEQLEEASKAATK